MKYTIAAWMAACAVLGTCLSQTDLEKANQLLQLDEDDRAHGALKKLAEDWDEGDVKGLFSLADSQTRHLDDEEEEFFVIAGRQYAQKHSEEALAYIDGAFRLMRNGDDDSPKAYLLKAMVKQLLFKDTDMMVQWIKAKPGREELIFKVEGDLLALFSQFAPEYMLERGKTNREIMMLGRPLAVLAKKDWKAAARHLAESEEDRVLGRSHVNLLATHLSSYNAETALTWLADLDADLAEDVRLAWMKDRNPTEAKAFLESRMETQGFLDEKSFEVVRGWATKDPEGARAWCEALPHEPTKEITLGMVADTWARKDPEAAGKWIASLGKGRVKTQGLRAMADALRHDDPTAAASWAEQLPERERERELRSIFTFWRRGDQAEKMKLMEASSLSEEEKARLRRRAQFDPRAGNLRKIMELSTQDPEAAKKLLAEMPAGMERDHISRFIDQRAANETPEMHAIMAKMRTDPKGAMKLLETLPEGPIKEETRERIQTRIDQIDPESARKRLAALPEGSDKEQAIRRSVMMVMRTDLEGAASLAELMAPPRRDQMLEMVYQQWLAKDPAKARIALEKSSLPEERKRFLQPKAEKK